MSERVAAGQRWGRRMKRFCSEIPAVDDALEEFVRELSNEQKRFYLERYKKANLTISGLIEVVEREVEGVVVEDENL